MTTIFQHHIDWSWTLFLDRDGVINHEKDLDYILNWEEFRFYDGVLEALKKLNPLFKNIVIVTNQRGVGKGLMSQQDLDHIHNNMCQQINLVGGRIDKVYACTDIDKNSFHRKPNAGMAFQAQQDFPTIDFKKSIMIGNKLSDMEFGKQVGMLTVFLATTNPEIPFPHPLINYRFNSLQDFVASFL